MWLAGAAAVGLLAIVVLAPADSWRALLAVALGVPAAVYAGMWLARHRHARRERERVARVLGLVDRLLASRGDLPEQLESVVEYLKAELNLADAGITLAANVDPAGEGDPAGGPADPSPAAAMTTHHQPLSFAGETLGTLSLTTRTPLPWLPARLRPGHSAGERRLVAAVAERLAAAILRERLRREAAAAVWDQLEDLRRALLTSAAADLHTAARLRMLLARLRDTVRRVSRHEAAPADRQNGNA